MQVNLVGNCNAIGAGTRTKRLDARFMVVYDLRGYSLISRALGGRKNGELRF